MIASTTSNTTYKSNLKAKKLFITSNFSKAYSMSSEIQRDTVTYKFIPSQNPNNLNVMYNLALLQFWVHRSDSVPVRYYYKPVIDQTLDDMCTAMSRLIEYYRQMPQHNQFRSVLDSINDETVIHVNEIQYVGWISL